MAWVWLSSSKKILQKVSVNIQIKWTSCSSEFRAAYWITGVEMSCWGTVCMWSSWKLWSVLFKHWLKLIWIYLFRMIFIYVVFLLWWRKVSTGTLTRLQAHTLQAACSVWSNHIASITFSHDCLLVLYGKH